jgi:hypothetical protein
MKRLIIPVLLVVATAACSVKSERTVQTAPAPAATTVTTPAGSATTVTTPAPAPAPTTTVHTR